MELRCDRAAGGSAASRESPDSALAFEVGGRKALVCYGRPAARGRTVFGGLVPFGELWRAGANEPTVVQLSFDAEVAGLSVRRGKYSLYAVPSREGWTLVLNRAIRQWGLTRPERGEKGTCFESAYTHLVQSAEVGRVPVATETIDHVEELTMRAEPVDDGGTDLLLDWETTRVRIPIRLRDSSAEKATLLG
ncbi:MAG: DUF2911 domain-containing protein [Gemmatimonadota bacterium]